ncbi:MAG: diguanylate cyclase domain-containing protein [Leptolyngbyaceae cyanobacterium]|mgnify:FL=1
MSRSPHAPSNSLNFSDWLLSVVESESDRFFNNLLIGIVVHAADGRVAYCNEAAQSLFGPIAESPVAPDNWAYWSQLYLVGTETPYPPARLPATQALQGQSVCLQDVELHRDDGRIRLQANALPVRNEQGQITHVIVAFENLTESVSLAVAPAPDLQQSVREEPSHPATLASAGQAPPRVDDEMRRLETVAEGLPGGLYSLCVKADGTLQGEYVNRQIEAIYEAPRTAILRAPRRYLGRQMQAADRPGFAAAITQSTAALSVFVYAWRTVSPSGRLRHLQTYAQPERRANGDVCWHGWLLDVSQHQWSEPWTHPQAMQSEAILRAIPDLIVRLRRDGRFISRVRNNPDIDMLLPGDEPLGCPLGDYMPAAAAAQHVAFIQTALDDRTVQMFEQVLSVQGRIQYEEVRIVPCGPDEVLEIVRDISDRKLLEQSLRQQEEQHRRIIEALPDLMFRVTCDGYRSSYVRTNATIDYIADDYDPIGQHLSEHMPAEVAQQQLEKIRLVATTGQMQMFEQQLRVNGRVQYEEVRIIPYSAEEVLFIVRNITDRKATELALQQSEAENRAIVAAMPDLMFRLHRDGTFLGYCKSGKTHDLLENVADPVGHNIFDFADTYLHQKTHIERKMQVVSQVLATGEMQVYEQQTSFNGDIQYEEVRVVPSGEDEALLMIQNISDRKVAEQALQQNEAQKAAILKAIPDLMFHMRQDGLILNYLSGANFADLCAPGSKQIGHNLKEYATTDALKQHINQKMQAMQQALSTGEVQLYEQTVDIGGVPQYEEVRVVPVTADEVLVMVRDISERRRIELELRSANERLAELSLTDSLTTLANRRSLDEHLDREWQRSSREQQPLSFILFDLDFFKQFNDAYGHQAGDDCLYQVAQAALAAVNRAADLVARYGGEEFAVILANTELKGAYTIAQRIRDNIVQLNLPHASSPVHAVVTASLGVSAIVPLPETLPNVLIRQADQALYSAKQAGRNNCQCFISR